MSVTDSETRIQAFMAEKTGALSAKDLRLIAAITPAYDRLVDEIERHSALTPEEAKAKGLELLLVDSFSFVSALEKVYVSLPLNNADKKTLSERESRSLASQKALDFTMELGLFKIYQRFEEETPAKNDEVNHVR